MGKQKWIDYKKLKEGKYTPKQTRIYYRNKFLWWLKNLLKRLFFWFLGKIGYIEQGIVWKEENYQKKKINQESLKSMREENRQKKQKEKEERDHIFKRDEEYKQRQLKKLEKKELDEIHRKQFEKENQKLLDDLDF